MKSWWALTFFLWSMPAYALKIITLNPALTEMVFALHQEKTLVGTVAESDQPEAAKKILRIGNYVKPSIEKIVELKPDLVLTFKEGIDQISPQLHRAGITLKTYSAKKIEDFAPLMKDLGQDLHAQERAQDLIQKWNQEWKNLAKSPSEKAVVLELDQTPLIVAGGDTFLSEILSRCGFRNSFGAKTGYPTLSWESVFNKDIDMIAVLIENLTRKEEHDLRQKWMGLPSFHDKKIVFFDPHQLSRLAPGLPAAATRFCSALEAKP